MIASNQLQIPMGLQLTRGGGGEVGGSISWSHDVAEPIPETLFNRLFANASVRGGANGSKTRRRLSPTTKTRKVSSFFSFLHRR